MAPGFGHNGKDANDYVMQLLETRRARYRIVATLKDGKHTEKPLPPRRDSFGCTTWVVLRVHSALQWGLAYGLVVVSKLDGRLISSW